MIGAFEAKEPSVGVFWVAEVGAGKARLLTAGDVHLKLQNAMAIA